MAANMVGLPDVACRPLEILTSRDRLSRNTDLPRHRRNSSSTTTDGSTVTTTMMAMGRFIADSTRRRDTHENLRHLVVILEVSTGLLREERKMGRTWEGAAT